MDTSNYRPSQAGGSNGGQSVDWRAQLSPDTRQKLVNRIMNHLDSHFTFTGPEKLHELKDLALRFEEKIYTAATSQADYIKKISMKLMKVNTKTENSVPGSLSKPAGNSVNPSDPVSQGMQQVNNQGQPFPIPAPSNHPQGGKQIHNNVSSSGAQGSAGVSSALPPASGISQATTPNISGHNSSLQSIQNISGVQLNSVGNSMGNGIPSSKFVSKRQIPGRQQPAPQQQQQSETLQQHLYQQQSLQFAKQELQQNNSTTSMQSHIQQQCQNLLQPSHFQSSQQSVLHPTMLQPYSLSTGKQNPSAQHLIQHHQQSVVRQQRQHQQQTHLNPMGHQTRGPNLHLNKLIVQQNDLSSSQQRQQHSNGQHNNFYAIHQKHLGPQRSAEGQKHHQHQLHGTQSGNPAMLNNQHSANLQQSKVSVPQQNQPMQGQRSLLELQQQVMPQLHTQAGQFPNQSNMKPQSNMSQRDMQQRLPASGVFQQKNLLDQQKLFQQQRAMPEASSTSSDSTAQTGNPNGGDWKEEAYQKMKALKDKYLPAVNDVYPKIVESLKRYGSVPHQPKGQQFERLKTVKNVLDRCVSFLQLPKNYISPNHKEQLVLCERHIVSILNLTGPNKRNPAVTLQQALPQALTTPQLKLHENQMSSQMQSVNIQGNNMANLQNSSVSNAQHNMTGAKQLNIDPGQISTVNSLLKVAGCSLQQNAGSSQLVNINPLSSQGGMGVTQPNSSMLQHPQLKKLQQRQMQQQFLQKQLLHQQHQFHLPTKQQQQNGNELKLRQQIGVKSESLQQQQQHVATHRSANSPQLKSGCPFSTQLVPTSYPQLDQQNLLSSLTKPVTPLQSANSPFIGVPSLSNVGNIGHQPNGATLPSQTLVIGTPVMSASPLLAEFESPDGNHGNGVSVVSGNSSTIEDPMERLLKLVKSISPKSLRASVNEIGSVVSMVDSIAGSAPGNSSAGAVGEDLIAMTKDHLQGSTFVAEDGKSRTRKMKRVTGPMTLTVVSHANDVNDSFKNLSYVEASEWESTATSTIKRPRIEKSYPLLEEIREINQGLIDTVVDICEEDANPAAASEIGKGTIVKCSFSPVALDPNLKSQYASAQMSPIQPLQLLVPANYPSCSPILLDKVPAEVSKEYEDLSIKAKWRFNSCVRRLSEPLSLEEMARTWDVCARAIIVEFVQQSGGGGTFTSKHGAWEDCLCCMN